MLLASLAAVPEAAVAGQEDTYRLLIGVLLRDPGELEQLRASTIAPLVAYDAEHEASLLVTLATFLARPFAGRTHDPMSGFFALRRATYERAERLTPMGYKVGLELMCKCRVRNVRAAAVDSGEAVK